MIKKISQLNELPLSAYDSRLMDQDEITVKNYNGMLFEVSYKTANDYDPEEADEMDYYTSYNIKLSGLSEALRIPELCADLCASISSLYNGGLSVISGDLTIGTPNITRKDCVDTVSCDTRHRTIIYSRISANNDLTLHGELTTHNKVTMLGHNAVISCQGSAYFDQLINGIAYRAQWGDLAEYYSADEPYEPGTLVKFGGKNEITVAKDKANGVVTTNPGVILNGVDGMENPVGVALVGKVPIRIRGPVHKFDKIVLSRTDPGIGVVYNFAPMYEIVGRALEENLDKEEKLVVCATKFNLI